MSKEADERAKRQQRITRITRKTSRQFDGWGGAKKHVYEFKPPNSVVSAHSCLMPKFSITLRVGALRKLIADLEDEDGLTVTVAEHAASKFTFVR